MSKNQNSEAQQICAQKLKELQNLLKSGFTTTNSVAIKKSVQKKTSSGHKIGWTSWCVDQQGHKFLALLDGEKIKLIPEDDMPEYIIKTIK